MDLRGVLIPTATPFDAQGELATAAFRANVRAWLRTPIAGLVVGGSTGEAVYLDEEERLRLLDVARDELGDRLLVAGTGAESTRATLRLTRDAADAGADAVLVQPPAFYRGAMTPGALEVHYRAVADASPVPVIVYQVPLRMSTLDMPNALVARLSEHPNVVGIKDSRGRLELVTELVETCAAGFQVLVGTGALLFDALETGAAGGILGVANLLPGESAAVVSAWRDGRTDEAAELQALVAPVHQAVVGGMGVPGVKAGLDLMGLYGGSPRPPLHPLPEARIGELREVLAQAGVAISPPGTPERSSV